MGYGGCLKDAIHLHLWCCALGMFILAGGVAQGAAQDRYYVTLSNSRARALAMGGAVTAVVDDIASLSYNPATFSLFRDRERPRFVVVFNPVLPVVSYDQEDHFDINRSTALKALFEAFQYLVKSVGISFNRFDIGFLLYEEQIMRRTGDRFFNGEGFTDNQYHVGVACLKLSDQVSLGVSGSLIRSKVGDALEQGSGLSYGIFVRPNRLYQVGVMYYNISDNIHSHRRLFERLADESLNAGIALMPWRGVTLSVDVRNLTETDKPENFGLQEFHLGFELHRIDHLTLRAGFYRERNGVKDYTYVYSMGIGLVDLNVLLPFERRFDHHTPLVSYTMLIEDTPDISTYWHMLSLGIRL